MQRLEEHIKQLEVDAAAHRRKRSSSDEETHTGQDGEGDGELLMLHAVVLGRTYPLSLCPLSLPSLTCRRGCHGSSGKV